MEIFISQEQLDDMDESQLKFIFDQAEKQLKDSLSIGDTLVTRTTTSLTIVSGLLVGLVGYAINRWEMSKIDPLFYSAVLSMLYLFVPASMLCSLIIPAQYSISGSPPKPFFNDTFFNETVKRN